MTQSTGMLISFINLLALLMGGTAVIWVFRMARNNRHPFVMYYFSYLVLAVTAGFCDWIIFNWVTLLMPGLSASTVDFIYHIFWDMLGLPAAIFALCHLFFALAALYDRPVSRQGRRVILAVALLLMLLSYFSFYGRLQETGKVLNRFMHILFVFVMPAVHLILLFIAFARELLLRQKDRMYRGFIASFAILYLIWVLLSLLPLPGKNWHHLIIISYYSALFIPAWRLRAIRGIRASDGTAGHPDHWQLTLREQEVVRLIVDGYSNQEISDTLHISLQTVKNYISRIYQKADVRNRVALINSLRADGEADHP